MRHGFPVAAMVALLACGGGGGKQGDAADDEVAEVPDVAEVPADVEGEDVVEVEGPCASDEECSDGDPCTFDECDTAFGDCTHVDLDSDEDGYVAMFAPDGTACSGSDCDDLDPDVNPGSDSRSCDSDDDCNGNLDSDNDGDGYHRESCGGDDCDDENAGRNPGIAPGCGDDATDPLSDLDCNGNPDADNDADGSDAAGCGGTDCDDGRPDVHPGATEVCRDGVDQDCDGKVDWPVAMLTTGTLVTNLEGTGAWHSLTWTGSEYGVTFASPSDPSEHREVYAWTLDAVGATVLTGVPRLTDDAWLSSSDPDVVWTGSRYTIAYEKVTNWLLGYKSIHLMHRSRDWSIIGTEIPLASGAHEQAAPSLAWTGSEFGICWHQGWTNLDVRCNAFTEAGTTRWSPGIFIAVMGRAAAYPYLVWTGSEYGLTWTVFTPSVNDGEAYFQRVSAGGSRVGTPLALTTGSSLVYSYAARSAWSGSEWAVTWSETPDGSMTSNVYTMLVSPTGTATSSPVRVNSVADAALTPVPAWTGSEYLVSWMDGRSGLGSVQIFVRSFDPSLTPVSDDVQFTSTSTPSAVPEPEVAVGEVGIVWVEEGPGGTTDLDVYFNRVGFCD